ncbi:MAG: hypothetical protein PHD03_03820 [Bacilli bacterium]|nr:hypothetical protein [Bacilli bacterium]MDD4407220.1 hypothetical protein [Bacilli bacterium]
MVEYTLLEKIKTLFNLVTNSPLFLILLFGIFLMIIDITFISKADKKTKIIYSIVSIIVIILLMNSYFNSLISLFDTIAKNIVSIIYFPTMLQYILMLLVSLIILIFCITSKKININVKRINILVLIINTFLFFLILDQINDNNVDLASKVSIYSNSILMILLELSIALFVVWIIGLILYKIIKRLSLRDTKVERIILDPQTFYNEPILPDNFSDLQKPKLKEEYLINQMNKKEELFTLDEYKQMKKILELIKKVTD